MCQFLALFANQILAGAAVYRNGSSATTRSMRLVYIDAFEQLRSEVARSDSGNSGKWSGRTDAAIPRVWSAPQFRMILILEDSCRTSSQVIFLLDRKKGMVTMRAALFSTALAGIVGVMCATTSTQTAPAREDIPGAKPQPQPDQRFDKVVRADLFAGFGGDEAALQKGLAQCEATLAANPKHAEALVWRGAVRVFQSSQLFGKKQMIAGMSLWSQGIQDMDDAVAIAPANPGVRIPRAAVLLPASRSTPAAMSKPLLVRVLDDYQTIAKLQANHLDTLGTHPLGELRMGLADVYRVLGDLPNSEAQLKLIKKQLPDTAYAERAQVWLDAKPDQKLVHNCIGCHGQ